MRASVLSIVPLLAFASAQTGKQGDAIEVQNNPAGAAYIATLPNKSSTSLRGYVLASAGQGGKGVNFAISFSGIPAEGGPFLYHIHDAPVPADGNCTATLAHLDPFVRGEDPPCDASNPKTCQVGDLSGKYGKPQNGSTYSASYTDAFAALVPGIGAFFGNRSIVFHYANKTRISCANFVPLSASATPAQAACNLPVDSSSASSAAPAAASGSPSSRSNSTDTSGQSKPISTASASPTSGSSATQSSKAPVVQATSNAGVPSAQFVNSAVLLGGVAAAALML